QAEDGIRDRTVTGVQTCALPICTSGIRLVELISRTLQRRLVRGSEVDLRKSREGPEVGVREAVEAERVGVARQAGHLRIVARILAEGEQVAPDHAQPQAADPETELLQRAAAERIADV